MHYLRLAPLQHPQKVPLHLLKPLPRLYNQVCEVRCLLVFLLPLGQRLVVPGLAHEFAGLPESLVVYEVDIRVGVIIPFLF